MKKDYGWILIELSIFNFSLNFTGLDLQKIFSVSYQSKMVPNQAKIDLDFIKILFFNKFHRRILDSWMVQIELSIFDFSSNFTGPDLQKFSVFELSRNMLVINQKRIPSKIDQDVMKMVSITPEGLWMVSVRIADFWFFVKFYRSGPAKMFSFWTSLNMLVIN